MDYPWCKWLCSCSKLWLFRTSCVLNHPRQYLHFHPFLMVLFPLLSLFQPAGTRENAQNFGRLLLRCHLHQRKALLQFSSQKFGAHQTLARAGEIHVAWRAWGVLDGGDWHWDGKDYVWWRPLICLESASRIDDQLWMGLRPTFDTIRKVVSHCRRCYSPTYPWIQPDLSCLRFQIEIIQPRNQVWPLRFSHQPQHPNSKRAIRRTNIQTSRGAGRCTYVFPSVHTYIVQ